MRRIDVLHYINYKLLFTRLLCPGGLNCVQSSEGDTLEGHNTMGELYVRRGGGEGRTRRNPENTDVER